MGPQVERVGHAGLAKSPSCSSTRPSPPTQASFSDELAAASLRFSKHAQDRLLRRGINVGSAELQRMQNAVELAAKRGANDSLVLLGQVAFLVNVPSRTVITALDASPGAGKIFTNIDSVILA